MHHSEAMYQEQKTRAEPQENKSEVWTLYQILFIRILAHDDICVYDK